MTNSQIKKIAFTFDYDGITKTIRTKCGVEKAFYSKEQYRAIPYDFTSLWDTGATSSVISTKVVNTLGLVSIGRTKIYHADGESIVNKHIVSIFLPNNILVPVLKVTESKLTNIDVLIGMDIITAGDFVITEPNRKTKFSFQIPSTHNTDYENEINNI
jgi:predicted aspartyl protease